MTGAFAAALLVSQAVTPCDEVSLRRMKPMMATLVTITARGCDAEALEARLREAFAEMERLAGILSEWDPRSATSRINDNAGIAPVEVPPELEEVLRAAEETSHLTSGAFDATWAALAPLWKFKRGGKCGTEVSDLFPHVRECVDDICLVRSMHGDHNDHFQATLGIHTGSVTFAQKTSQQDQIWGGSGIRY